jgi:preprotein translocase subunit YajC
MNKLQSIVLQAPAAPAAGAEGGSGIILLAYGLMFVAFYFFVIAPQRKQQKEIRKFQDALATGAHVMTTGGIFGKVVQVSEDRVTLQIAEGVRISVLRSAVVGAPGESDKVIGQASLN